MAAVASIIWIAPLFFVYLNVKNKGTNEKKNS
jgi:hypothetical protein